MTFRCCLSACFCLLPMACLWSQTPIMGAASAVESVAVDEAAVQAEIEGWIEKLGDESYAQRVRAKNELRRMGLMAFDLLHNASTHDDSEVAIAARHLISSMEVSWATESDPQAVREVLEGYGTSRKEAERKTRIDRLAQLPDRIGLGALCRLVRFESSLRLSRDAALLVMQQPLLGSPAARAHSADTIIGQLGTNQRSASVWLKVYADDLRRGVYDADRWRKLIEKERSLVDGRRSLQTDADAVLELVRVCAVRAQSAQNDDEAMRLALETLSMVPPGRNSSIEAATWALDHQLYAVVKKMQERQPIPFSKEPLLLYAVAEAHQVEGDQEQAEQIAGQALAINSLPAKHSDEAQKMSVDAKDNIAFKHQVIARTLRNRGQFKWAIREFQHIIDSLDVDVVIAATTRWQMAELLGDLQSHQAVLDTLQPIQDRMRSDNEYELRLRNTKISAAALDVRLNLHQGLLLSQQGKHAEAQQPLLEALRASGRNADIVIAMHRLPGDQKWQDRVKREIEAMTAMFEEQVLADERDYRESNSPNNTDNLAGSLNDYAWLVSNTFGDQRKALRYSLRSLELQPDDPMLLDTCGRCYFALNDLQNAVAKQARAAELAPEQPEVQRQLAEFKAAFAKATDK